MIGDELLPKRSPDSNEWLVMINRTDHVKYRNGIQFNSITILTTGGTVSMVADDESFGDAGKCYIRHGYILITNIVII